MARPRTDMAEYQAVSIRFPKALLAYFRQRAIRARRSLNAEVLLTIEECLRREAAEDHHMARVS